MITDLARLDDLGAELARRARSAGVFLVWRAQVRSVRHALVRQGRPEIVGVSAVSGHGMQVTTAEGHTVLASRDDLEPEPALALLASAIASAGTGGALRLARAVPPTLDPLVEREVPTGLVPPDRVALPDVVARLAEIEAELAGRVPGVTLQVGYRAELEGWRIFRSDGTDVLFAIPRCTLTLRATSAGDGARHGVSAAVFGTRADLPWSDVAVARFLRRAETAARLAAALPGAPAHPAGAFPLVIDYGLAKGLAHEAFGHAAEADGFRSSVLARNGRFRRGDVVGAAHVSIVDEPIVGDHAWQPFSANGIRRRRATIVEHGRLGDALTDLWSAGPAGAALTGAERAESFRHAPQPRMTNIRIEVDAPIDAPGAFEDYTPERVRDLLGSAGVLRRHPRIAYLSGYTGGQVNPATGDFVFNCQAIYGLGPEGATLFRPAIFSGSMFGALGAVREAFGPLQLDALGYCGKCGQRVPSSGGSHYFLVLDADPTVRLGGR